MYFSDYAGGDARKERFTPSTVYVVEKKHYCSNIPCVTASMTPEEEDAVHNAVTVKSVLEILKAYSELIAFHSTSDQRGMFHVSLDVADTDKPAHKRSGLVAYCEPWESIKLSKSLADAAKEIDPEKRIAVFVSISVIRNFAAASTLGSVQFVVERDAYESIDCVKSIGVVDAAERLMTMVNRAILPVAYQCANCQKVHTHAIQRCGACNAARYCDAQCQKKHWNSGHKSTCLLVKMLGSDYKRRVCLDKERRHANTAA